MQYSNLFHRFLTVYDSPNGKVLGHVDSGFAASCTRETVGETSTRIRSVDTGAGYMIACFGRGLSTSHGTIRRHAFTNDRTIRRRFKIVYSIFYRMLQQYYICLLSNLELIYMVYLKEQDILYLRSKSSRNACRRPVLLLLLLLSLLALLSSMHFYHS